MVPEVPGLAGLVPRAPCRCHPRATYTRRWLTRTHRSLEQLCLDPFRIVVDTEYDSVPVAPDTDDEASVPPLAHRQRLAEALQATCNADPDSRRRVDYILQFVRYTQKHGHYWVPLDRLLHDAVDQAEFRRLAASGALPAVYADDDLVSLRRYDDVERGIARALVPLLDTHLGASASGTEDAYRLLASAKVCVLTGAAGTGKTTLVRRVLDDRRTRDHGGVTVCAAPTGKAALRMREATGQPASTLHSLLYRRFGRGGVQLVLDEQSMQDPEVLYHCLRTIGARLESLVVIGDPAQLQSIGRGNLLADLVASCLPLATLVDIHRSEASLIAENARAIRSGSAELALADGIFEVITVDGLQGFLGSLSSDWYTGRYGVDSARRPGL